MGEEVKMAEYDGDAEERILDWESGLPSADDLTPLSQALIPPELASAFSISPVTFRTAVEVNQASRDTLSNLRGYKPPESHDEDDDDDDDDGGSESRKARRIEAEEAAAEGSEEAAARTLKRPRLVWTPQLHKRFVDVVGHLGIKNAVPKTIMQLMNVEGLTRENVASHLQKYRLYLKRMQGLSPSSDSPSSDHLSSDSPPNSDGHHHHFPMPVPMPMPMPMPMPVMGMGPPPPHPPPPGYHHHHHHHHHHQFNMYQQQQQQRDWSAANNYGSVATYPHLAPTDN